MRATGMQGARMAGQWEQGLIVLHKMRGSRSAAISANENGEHWKQALLLFDKMRHSGMSANVINFSAAISACEKDRDVGKQLISLWVKS